MRICKEQILKKIMTMDKHKRRELVEQPHSSLSQYLLDHLVYENQTAKARQLSTLRFRINTDEHLLYNEIEGTSSADTDTQVDLSSLSKELLEQVKEFLKDEEPLPTVDDEEPLPTVDDKEPSPTVDDDEIEVLAPPVKTPPPCIDLDSEVSGSSPPFALPQSCNLTAKNPCEEQSIPKEPEVIQHIDDSGSYDKAEQATMPPLPPSDNQNKQEISTSLRDSLLDLFLEEKSYQDRINAIDQSFEQLNTERKIFMDRFNQSFEQLITERKNLMDRIMEIKLRQIDVTSPVEYEIDPFQPMTQVISALSFLT